MSSDSFRQVTNHLKKKEIEEREIEKKKNHYFECGHCGYIGKESELIDDGSHPCGKDQCPECDVENVISCCFKTYHDAEIEHREDDE